MEFVVLLGGQPAQAESVANTLRAHGYRHFCPKQFFVDDFGDLHLQEERWAEAEDWCYSHVKTELSRHHDVVMHGLMLNPELVRDAQGAGYRLTVLRLGQLDHHAVQPQIEALIAAHEAQHPTILGRLLSR